MIKQIFLFVFSLPILGASKEYNFSGKKISQVFKKCGLAHNEEVVKIFENGDGFDAYEILFSLEALAKAEHNNASLGSKVRAAESVFNKRNCYLESLLSKHDLQNITNEVQINMQKFKDHFLQLTIAHLQNPALNHEKLVGVAEELELVAEREIKALPFYKFKEKSDLKSKSAFFKCMKDNIIDHNLNFEERRKCARDLGGLDQLDMDSAQISKEIVWAVERVND